MYGMAFLCTFLASKAVTIEEEGLAPCENPDVMQHSSPVERTRGGIRVSNGMEVLMMLLKPFA